MPITLTGTGITAPSISAGVFNESATLEVASASTTDLGTVLSNNVDITGTVTITGFGTVAAGIIKQGRFTGALTLTHHATSLILPGAVDYATAVDDTYVARSLGSGNWRVLSVGGRVTRTATAKLPGVTATVAGGGLTLGCPPEYLTFRSATLASGAVSTILAAPVNIVVPSGATLGTVNAVESTLLLLVLNNVGVAELAVINQLGGSVLDEIGLITTTILDDASDNVNVAYSATARTSLPYRVLGKVRSTQATAGAWATAPSRLHGTGGLAEVMVGTVVQMRAIQTRTIATYAAPVDGNGTKVTPLDIVITPRKAGNAMILEWHCNGEMHHDTVYIVQRNGALLADTTNAANNRWAGVMAQPYDVDVASTPDNAILRITDFNTLATATTYSLHVRASGATAYTLYLNSSVLAPADNYETSISTGTATEVQQ